MSPGQLDAALVHRHLAALEAAVRHLRRHAGQAPEALRNVDEAWAIERGLQICVQNCLDVATHLSAAAGLDVPDYTTAFDRLEELGVLPGEFARRFRAVAGFRNVLVHGYLDVDAALVHRILNERLDDFEVFARRVEDHLARAGAGG
jgi:uncharacterized protein YutE (UPF0331/DUF86 family)